MKHFMLQCDWLHCTNKTLHGGSDSDCCTQSELQRYTKALAFIRPTAHQSPKHNSGSQEVSMFHAAHWLWHSQQQHFILHSLRTQQRRTVVFSLSKQVCPVLAHRTFNPLCICRVLMRHRVSTIRSKPDVLQPVESTFCPSIADKTPVWLHNLNLLLHCW